MSCNENSNQYFPLNINKGSAGNNCNLKANVYIDGNTEIGKNCTFYPFSSIGTNPQDLKYKGEKSRLKIGNNNIFREYVTVNPGTQGGGLLTKIGDNCLFMISSHVAHDCIIGDNVILVNKLKKLEMKLEHSKNQVEVKILLKTL